MRIQRDEARRQAHGLGRRIRIAAWLMVVTVLLVVGATAYAEAADA